MQLPAGLDRLSLSLGAYSGAFVAAALLLTTDVGVGNPTVVGAGLVTLVVVAAYVGRLPDVGERLSTSRGHVAILAVPFVIGMGVALQVSAAGGFLGAVPAAALLGFAAVLPAAVVYVVAENRHARKLRAEDPLVAWTAPPPAGHERRRKIAYVTIGGVLILGGFGLSFTVGFDPAFFAAVGGGVAAQVLSIGRTQTFEAHEEALVVDAGGVGVKVIPWSRFTGYEHADDQLILSRRVPGTSIHCDLSDVENADEISDALDHWIDGE